MKMLYILWGQNDLCFSHHAVLAGDGSQGLEGGGEERRKLHSVADAFIEAASFP